jgi:predicted nucleic acid-binding protein
MTNVTPVFFVDTNVIVYACDAREPLKRATAISVVELLSISRKGVISIQVLKEFCSAVLKKQILRPEEAAEILDDFVQAWTVFDVGSREVRAALRGVQLHQLEYYDALIWETARSNDVPFILSEDGQDGRLIEGVRYLNPFTPDFDMARLS